MNAESIVVSLEMAKRLAQAGWPQKDHFAWYIYPENPNAEPGEEANRSPDVGIRWEKGWKIKLESYSAPTAEEILRHLPVSFRKNGLEYVLEMNKYVDDSYGLWYTKTTASKNQRSGSYQTSRSFADAGAKLWIFLKQNNLLPA